MKVKQTSQKTLQNRGEEIYEKGIGVEQDMEKAMHWYQLAAAQGQDEALVRLRLTN